MISSAVTQVSWPRHISKKHLSRSSPSPLGWVTRRLARGQRRQYDFFVRLPVPALRRPEPQIRLSVPCRNNAFIKYTVPRESRYRPWRIS